MLRRSNGSKGRGLHVLRFSAEELLQGLDDVSESILWESSDRSPG